MFVSDGPKQFVNKTLSQLPKHQHVIHHFTLPYDQCSNNDIHALEASTVCVVCSVTSKYWLQATNENDFHPLVQYFFKHAPSHKRKHTPPVTVFTEQKLRPSISSFYKSCSASVIKLDKLKQELVFNIEQFHERREQPHPNINVSVKHTYFPTTSLIPKSFLPYLVIGDIGLVIHDSFTSDQKPSFSRQEQRSVIGALSNYVFTVEAFRIGDLDDKYG